MGRIFIESIDKPCYMCSLCSNQIVPKMGVLYDKVDTDIGLATGFIECKNTLCDTNYTIANFHRFDDTSGALDYDAPFDSIYTYSCTRLYCKVCFLHLGWKVEELCVILDSSFL